MRARLLQGGSVGLDWGASVTTSRSIHSSCQSSVRSTQVNVGHARCCATGAAADKCLPAPHPTTASDVISCGAIA